MRRHAYLASRPNVGQLISGEFFGKSRTLLPESVDWLEIRESRWYKKASAPRDDHDRRDRLATVRGVDCVVALKALAEETRLRILHLLLKEPLSVNDISVRLDVSQYNVSKHLRTMREAGLLEVQKQGRLHLYSVTANLRTQVTANRNVLDLGCCTFKLDKLPGDEGTASSDGR